MSTIFFRTNVFEKYRLEQMSRYLDLVHDAIQTAQEEFGDYLEGEAAKLPEDMRDDFYHHYLDTYGELRDDFPRLLFSNFVVSWYSYIEHRLFMICKTRKLKIEIGIEDSDKLESGIRRARKFLAKSEKYQIDNEHWEELVNIGRIRNKIVHNSGKLPFSYKNKDNSIEWKFDDEHFEPVYLHVDRNFYNYLQRNEIIVFSSVFYIVPTYEYCTHLLSFGDNLLRKIHDDLKNKR